MTTDLDASENAIMFRSKAQKLAQARAVLAAWNRERELKATKAVDTSAESAAAIVAQVHGAGLGWRPVAR